MELSEEEKKAIETLEIEGTENNFLEVRTLLNLVEKQQKEIEEKTTIIMAGAEKVKQLEKEIEELKKPKYIINCKTNEITKLSNDFISKDKIRKFIKDELPDDEIMECCDTYDVNGVRLREELEKLLEEN